MTDNSVLIKIHDGTGRSTGKNLYLSCRSARVTRGYNHEIMIVCGADNPMSRLNFSVQSCNRFISAQTPTLYEMEEIAWRLVTKTGGRAIGFVDAATYRDQHYQNIPRPSV